MNFTNNGQDLKARKAEVLARLDIAAEYAALGVEFTKSGPNAKGWRECRAMGREDRDPSARVNVRTGQYQSWGEGGESLSFWDFAVKYGRLGDFPAVLRHYEAKIGTAHGHATRKGARRQKKRRVFPSFDAAVASVEGTLEGVWTYRDQRGGEAFRVARFQVATEKGKTYRPIHLDPTAEGWVLEDPPGPLPLYRLPELLTLPGPVWIGEGEKVAELAAGLGLIATTSAHGGQSAHLTDWTPLAGRDVFLMPDNDKTGDEYANKVLGELAKLNPRPSVKVVRLSGLPEHGDLEQWLETLPDRMDNVQAREELERLAAEAPSWDFDRAPSANGHAAGTIDFKALSDEELGMVPATQVKMRSVRWIWQYHLAAGTMAMVAGDGGLGKSQILLAIAAAVTTGRAWPDRSGQAPHGDVILLSAEDNPEDTILPRLVALGANLDRVTILRARVVIRRAGQEPHVHPMSFQDRAYWREVFDRRPHCKLFGVDPLPSYLGRGVNDSKNSEVRAVMEPFIDEVIKPRDLCMLVNSHLNKAVDARTPMQRIVGSIAYGNLPRNVHFVVRDPEDPARRYLKQEKCNNAPDNLPALAFRVERREVIADGGEVIETAIPVFEPDPVMIDLRALVSGRSPNAEPTKDEDKAARWLAERLADGPAGSILCAMQGQVALGRRWPDTSEGEIARQGVLKWWREKILKARLGGASRKVGKTGPWFFTLPKHDWPPGDTAIQAARDAEAEGLPTVDSTPY